MVVIIFCCGCAKLRHFKQLLTLKSFAKEQGQLDQYVEERDKKFEELVKVYKTNSLNQFADKGSILDKFGEPIMIKDTIRNDQKLELWFYRYEMKFFDSEKIYLYFDQEDKLVDWEYIEARKSDEDTTYRTQWM